MADAAVFKSEIKPDWCPGCGDFGVLNALQKACADLNLEPKDIMVVSGIGCSSKSPAYFMSRSHSFNSVHGRMPSLATGAQLLRRRREVGRLDDAGADLPPGAAGLVAITRHGSERVMNDE